MTPYYQDEAVTLIHADCRDVLASLRADVVITSPPYNMRTRIRNGIYTEREKSEHFSLKYEAFSDAMPIEDYYDMHRTVIAALLDVAPLVFLNIQIVTGSKEAWFRIIGDFATAIKDVFIWDKGHGQPAMHGAVANRASELVLALEASRSGGRAFSRSFFRRGEMPDIWRFGGGRGDIASHGAVFPLDLAGHIIDGWSAAGDTILDPFAGTGTTLRAAKDRGRKAIGIEIAEPYCRIAADRCHQGVLNLGGVA